MISQEVYATTEADSKAATAFWAKEQVDFGKSEQELLDVIDTLARAVAVLAKEMKRESVHHAVAEGWKRGRDTSKSWFRRPPLILWTLPSLQRVGAECAGFR